MHRCAEWAYDRYTKNAVEELEKYYKNYGAKNGKIKLGINWIFEPTINYYRVTKHLDWLLPVDRNGISATDDFNYFYKNEVEPNELKNFELIKEYEIIGTMLAKRKNLDSIAAIP